ncbi:MAG: ABC transporter ATP-binding protein [Rhizobiaceae bacterium]
MSAPLADMRGLSVSFRDDGGPVRALDAVDLDIMAGETLALIGESSSGKSTLARALAGLLPSGATVEGCVEWPGFDGRTPEAGKDIGFVFQDPSSSLDPVLIIGEQVAEGAWRHLGLGRKAGLARAAELLARLRLPEPETLLMAYPHQLSGGQRQRVAIAAAIAAEPRFLIADEPTSALDTVVQAEIVTLLARLVREDGMTLLFVTHDIALASGFADRIAVLRGGGLMETGPAQAVLASPASAYTRTLIASHIGLETPPLVGGLA